MNTTSDSLKRKNSDYFKVQQTATGYVSLQRLRVMSFREYYLERLYLRLHKIYYKNLLRAPKNKISFFIASGKEIDDKIDNINHKIKSSKIL